MAFYFAAKNKLVPEYAVIKKVRFIAFKMHTADYKCFLQSAKLYKPG
jgi:hypothetical protein